MTEDDQKVSPMGEIVLASIADMEKHLETHNCSICVTKFETLLKAFIEWHLILAQLGTEKGDEHGNQEKNESSKEQSEEPEKDKSPGPDAGKKDDWDIFGDD